MKIAMLVNNLATSGGYQKLVLRLGQELKVLGHEITIYTPRLDTRVCYPEFIDQLSVCTLPQKVVEPVYLFERACTALRLRGKFKEIFPWKEVASLVKKDTEYIIYHDEQSLLAVTYLASLRAKTAWMVNNQLSRDFLPTSRLFQEQIKKLLLRPSFILQMIHLPFLMLRHRRLLHAARNLDFIGVYDLYNKNDVQIKTGCLATIVYAGADTAQFSAVGVGREKHSPARILSVGVLYPYRRNEDLIEAMALLQDKLVTLTIVGSSAFAPEYRKKLQSCIERHNLENRVEILERLPYQELLNLYKEADVFAFVNDGHTWGIAVFEAIAARLPVIITNNIGAVDLIKTEEEEFGWVVPPQCPEKIADAITAILDNPAHAKTITERAYQKILPVVSWNAYARRMVNLTKNVCSNRI